MAMGHGPRPPLLVVVCLLRKHLVLFVRSKGPNGSNCDLLCLCSPHPVGNGPQKSAEEASC